MVEQKDLSPPPFILRSIYLRSSQVIMQDGFDPLMPNQKLAAFNRVDGGNVRTQETHYQNESESGILKSCLFVTKFHFGYKILDDQITADETEFVAQILAEIAVDYQISSADFPDQERLNQWATSNCLLHAWPYWREFCHSTQMRMNLPSIVLPLLNLVQQQPK